MRNARLVSGLLAAVAIMALATGCSLSHAPPASGYVGIVFGYIDGKVALAHIAGAAPSMDECVTKMKLVKQAVTAGAPPGASVAALCVAIPAAPPSVARADQDKPDDEAGEGPDLSDDQKQT